MIRNPQLGLESIRITGAPRIWRLDSLQKQCRTGELLKHKKNEWNEKDWNMGYEHLVWDNELKYLGVKLENRIKNSKLLAKNFWILLHPYLDPTPASLRLSPPFTSGQSCWVLLYSGFINPCCRWVACAGLFWSLLHVSVWSRWWWGMMNGLWTMH